MIDGIDSVRSVVAQPDHMRVALCYRLSGSLILMGTSDWPSWLAEACGTLLLLYAWWCVCAALLSCTCVPRLLYWFWQVEQYLIKTEDIHEDFRLWITAEPHPNFPIGLLQMGIKITNEAPVGMKAGLRASYQWVSQVRLCNCVPDARCLELCKCQLAGSVM